MEFKCKYSVNDATHHCETVLTTHPIALGWIGFSAKYVKLKNQDLEICITFLPSKFSTQVNLYFYAIKYTTAA